jgi:hypothetical protein
LRQLNIDNTKGKWFKFKDDVELHIRPFPLSCGMIYRSLDVKIFAEYNLEQFKYCVTAWKGFVDEDNKNLECNDENKKLIFDYDSELVTYVFEKINSFNSNLVEQKKT